MIKSVTITLVVGIALSGTPLYAQTLQQQAKAATAVVAAAETKGATTQPASRGKTRLGVALIGAGAALAILGATVVKQGNETSDICEELNRDFGLGGDCDDLKGKNKPLIIGGAALIGVGATLLTIELTRSNSIQFEPNPARPSARYIFSF